MMVMRVYSQTGTKIGLVEVFLLFMVLKYQKIPAMIRLKMMCKKVKPTTIFIVVGNLICLTCASLNDGLDLHFSKYSATLGRDNTSLFQNS